MIIASIEAVPLRIPFKPGTQSATSAWGPKGLASEDMQSLLDFAHERKDAGGHTPSSTAQDGLTV
jgi:hypothetical protein